VVLILQIIVFFQDWKYRAVHIMLLGSIFLLGILQSYGLGMLDKTLGMSFGYVFGCMLFAYLIFVIKRKAFFNPFKELMGIGDIVYIIAVMPFFDFRNYMFFFVGSMLFSIVLFYGLKLMKYHLPTIPLAGFMALAFVLILVLKITDVVDCFYGQLLIL